MKKKKSNRRSIIVIIVMILCMALLYFLEVRQDKILDEKRINNQEVINASEDDVSLGEEDGCNYTSTYKGGNWVCGVNPSNTYNNNSTSNNFQCKMQYHLNCNNGCHQEKVRDSIVCSSCKAGFYMEYNQCKPIACQLVSISATQKVVAGSDISVNVTLKPKNCNTTNITVVCTNEHCQFGSVVGTSVGSENVTKSFTLTTSTSDQVCPNPQATFNVRNGSKVIGNKSTKLTRAFTGPTPVGIFNENLPGSEIIANSEGKDFYATGGCTGSGSNFTCTNVYSRSCGGISTPTPTVAPTATPTPTPTPVPEACYVKDGIYKWTNDTSYGTKTNKTREQCKNCYANATTLGNATSTIVADTSDTLHQYVLKNISIEGCVPPQRITYCEPQKINPSSQTINASSCENNVSLTYNDGYRCEGTSFYSISCDNTIVASYDNGHDTVGNNVGPIGTVNTIFPGEGFGFGVQLRIKKTCTARFNQSNWTNAYDIAVSEYNRANSILGRSGLSANEQTEYQSIKAEAQNKINYLKDVIRQYNNFDYTADIDQSVKFDLAYKVKGNRQILGTNFIQESKTGGTGKIIDRTPVSLNRSGVTNPYNYTWTNDASPYVVSYTFPKVYVDTKTGLIGPNGDIDAGNKLYTDYNADTGINDMTVSITLNNNVIRINNVKCQLEIKKAPTLLYRPIDVTNPFINAERKKGENWLNDQFDFVKTIHATTWSEPTFNEIKLSADDLAKIRKDNAENISLSPYLGMCGKRANESKDPLCPQIK